jgi:hypothetical protein
MSSGERSAGPSGADRRADRPRATGVLSAVTGDLSTGRPLTLGIDVDNPVDDVPAGP